MLQPPLSVAFYVPESMRLPVVTRDEISILFRDIMNPDDASVKTPSSGKPDEEPWIRVPIAQRYAKAAVAYYYKNVVRPRLPLEASEPQRQSRYFFTWLLHAMPKKFPEWDTEAWRNAFSN